ncbi:hypothetical protein [Cellulomonas soli]|nr:hypothetical protein [Cellulomonas soli]NYI57291.1 hypothetical protein [Cellulomonas soli]
MSGRPTLRVIAGGHHGEQFVLGGVERTGAGVAVALETGLLHG